MFKSLGSKGNRTNTKDIETEDDKQEGTIIETGLERKMAWMKQGFEDHVKEFRSQSQRSECCRYFYPVFSEDISFTSDFHPRGL